MRHDTRHYTRHRLHQLSILALLSLLPALADAQGRMVVRPCVRPCPPEVRCEIMRPSPCGARIERRSSTTRVQLIDRVLRYEVTEVFRNEGGVVGEADYMFPLPAGAAFEDLKLSINGELVAGETMSADKARGIYEEIVRRQRDPALVEWMGSGMLRARIFPIAPGEDKKVVVRYQSVATREGDALRIDYRRSGDFSLEYPRNGSYGTPYSPTHLLTTRSEERNFVVEASGSTSDLTVLLPLRRANTAGLSVLTHAVRGEPGFAMLTITPPTSAARATARDLTFVLDVSGSMLGRKLEQAKAAGHALLASLRASDRFRLIDFSTDVRTFRDGWIDATPENVREARRHLDRLNAEGSTNISEALRAALTDRTDDGERLPLVVFLTDGEPTVGERNPDAIAAIATRLRGDTRVFTVGVGTGVNAALVEQLALQGRGTAHFVRDDESVEAPVSLLARRLAEPVLTDVRVVANGVRLSRVMPNGPIDVFAGQDLIVLARYDGSGEATVRLEGRGSTGPITWSTHARFESENRANPFVPRLWAAQRIGWLAAEKRRHGGTTELDGEIKSLGERYGIPTEFSSYLVLEPGMTIASAPLPRSAPTMGGNMPARASKAAGGFASGASANATLQQVTVTSAPASAEARFESARDAAAQRETKSIASLDGMLDRDRRGGLAETRAVGNRRLSLVNGVWTDARYTSSMRTVRVKPFSPLYFELLHRMPELQDLFALGDRVIAAGRTVAIELATDGSERVDEQLLAGLKRDW